MGVKPWHAQEVWGETCPLGLCRAFIATPLTSTGTSLTLRRCCTTRGSWRLRIVEHFRYGCGIPLLWISLECCLGRLAWFEEQLQSLFPKMMLIPWAWSRPILPFIYCCSSRDGAQTHDSAAPGF